MSTNTTDDFRYDINALRAIAIIAVVAYHYGIKGFAGGFAGVDIFFVISGYLITAHIARDLNQKRCSLSAFYVSRIRRIFPALAVMCMACAVWGWYFVLPRDYLANTRHELDALLFFSNYAFNDERGYFDIASSSKPLLHTWSLSVEGQFYLFLPLLMAAIWRFNTKYSTTFILLLFLASLDWCLYYSTIDAGSAFYQLTTRTWEFLAGSLLTLLAIKKPNALLANIGNVIALSLLFISICWLNFTLHWPSGYTLIPVVGSAILIISGDALLTRWFFNSWLLQRLGDISYSLYLWHWPVLVFGKHFAKTRLDRELSHPENLALIGLALLLAILSWRFVEKPIRFKQGWWTTKRVWQGALLTVACFIVLTIAAAITKGFPNRLPDYVQRGFATVALNTPRSECFRNESSIKSASEQFCQFGAENQQPSLLLWGDSHANMYLSALSKAAKDAGITGYIATESGCRATLPDQPNDLKDSAGVACTNFNNEVNAFLANNPSIHTIIIARMWAGGDSSDRTFKLVNQLVEQGKKVIVVGPVPYFAFNVSERWISQQIKAKQAINTMTDPVITQQSLLDLQGLMQKQLSAPIANGRVIWIDPMQKLCGKTECLLVQQGVSYFKDVTHLSEAGAMLFTDDFSAALMKTR
jgi:peptidoglycan/LPS O-acetylase OafA/YrhL